MASESYKNDDKNEVYVDDKSHKKARLVRAKMLKKKSLRMQKVKMLKEKLRTDAIQQV